MWVVHEVSEKNKRSKLIAEAVEIYAGELKRKSLRERLMKGYQLRAERDKSIAEEWFDTDQEVYEKEEKFLNYLSSSSSILSS